MAESQPQIYQLRVTLLFVEDEIWRSILVPENYTFWDLSVAIKDAFEIPACHKHHFQIGNYLSQNPMLVVLHGEVGQHQLDGKQTLISGYFFGNRVYFEEEPEVGWQYSVLFESVRERFPRQKFPQCIDGEWANPPPYCTNAEQYGQFLEILNETEDMEDIGELEKRLQTFLGDEHFVWDDYDPNYFDPTKVEFSNLK